MGIIRKFFLYQHLRKGANPYPDERGYSVMDFTAEGILERMKQDLKNPDTRD